MVNTVGSAHGVFVTVNGPSPAAAIAKVPDVRLSATALTAFTPKHIGEAVSNKRPDWLKWLAAVIRDFEILRMHKSFENITLVKPSGRVINMKQIFKYKNVAESVILGDLPDNARKARTVAEGQNMVYGAQYVDTWAPVTRWETIKMMLAYAINTGLYLFQADCDHAFNGAKMDVAGVWVKLPRGYNQDSAELRDLNAPDQFATLAAGVPGIKQGSFLFNKKFDSDICALGFVASAIDKCLYINRLEQSFVVLFVDDFIAATINHAAMKELIKKLSKNLTITRWGPLREALGMTFVIEYTPTLRSVFVSQESLAKIIVQRAGLQDANPAKMPGAPGMLFSKRDGPANSEEMRELEAAGHYKKNYVSLVAATNFITCCTRFDLKFHQGKLSTMMQNPGLKHFQALKNFLRFLKGTAHYGIQFTWRLEDPVQASKLVLTSFSDSSMNDCPDTHRSTICFVTLVNGTPLTCYSKLAKRTDTCINHSEARAHAASLDLTFENHVEADMVVWDSEVCGISFAARDIKYLRGLSAEFMGIHLDAVPPVRTYVDNAGVLALLEHPIHHEANKHIAHTIAQVREAVQDLNIVPTKIAAELNLADSGTKQPHGPAAIADRLRLAAPQATALLPPVVRERVD